MSKKIFVGNLPFDVSEDDVRNLFTPFGAVESVTLVADRETGRLRGFGFVEMAPEAAASAIAALDKTDFGGRSLNVNEAKPRTESRAPRRPRW